MSSGTGVRLYRDMRVRDMTTDRVKIGRGLGLDMSSGTGARMMIGSAV